MKQFLLIAFVMAGSCFATTTMAQEKQKKMKSSTSTTTSQHVVIDSMTRMQKPAVHTQPTTRIDSMKMMQKNRK